MYGCIMRMHKDLKRKDDLKGFKIEARTIDQVSSYVKHEIKKKEKHIMDLRTSQAKKEKKLNDQIIELTKSYEAIKVEDIEIIPESKEITELVNFTEIAKREIKKNEELFEMIIEESKRENLKLEVLGFSDTKIIEELKRENFQKEEHIIDIKNRLLISETESIERGATIDRFKVEIEKVKSVSRDLLKKLDLSSDFNKDYIYHCQEINIRNLREVNSKYKIFCESVVTQFPVLLDQYNHIFD